MTDLEILLAQQREATEHLLVALESYRDFLKAVLEMYERPSGE